MTASCLFNIWLSWFWCAQSRDHQKPCCCLDVSLFILGIFIENLRILIWHMSISEKVGEVVYAPTYTPTARFSVRKTQQPVHWWRILLSGIIIIIIIQGFYVRESDTYPLVVKTLHYTMHCIWNGFTSRDRCQWIVFKGSGKAGCSFFLNIFDNIDNSFINMVWNIYTHIIVYHK